MIRVYLTALLSMRTIVAAGIVVAYSVFYVTTVAAVPGTNAWDALIPTFTETATISQVGLLWWVLMLLPVIRSFGRVDVLLRHGSYLRAVLAGMRESMVSLAAGVTVLILAGIVATFTFSPSLHWSAPTIAASTSEIDVGVSAFSAANLAKFFPSPVLALIVCAAFTMVAFLIIAFLDLAITARLGRRDGVAILSIFYLWAALCSFSAAGITPALDASNLLSLPWALYTGNVLGALVVLGSMAALGILLIRVRRSHFQAWATDRFMLPVALLVVVGLAMWNAAGAQQSPPEVMRGFFAGAYGDLLEYALTSFITLGYATGYAARLTEHIGDLFWTETLRDGSYRRWAVRSLVNEINPLFAFLFAALMLMAGVTSVIDGLSGLTDLKLWTLVLHGLLGFGLEIVFLCVLVVLLFWTTGSVALWPVIAGTSLVLGYPILGNLGPLNIFAPYSLQQDPTISTTFAPLITTVAFVFCALLIVIMRSPHAAAPSSTPRNLTYRTGAVNVGG